MRKLPTRLVDYSTLPDGRVRVVAGELVQDSSTPASSVVDIRGDLLVASADDTLARLPVGADGQVLTADATAANGIKWADLTGGSGGGATTLDGLTDVDTTTTPPTNGQALVYDSANATWKPGSGAVAATPVLVGVTSVVVPNTNTVTVAVPTGTQAGDVLILVSGHGYSTNTPAGWAQLDRLDGSGIGGLTAAKSAVSADVGGSVTATFTGAFWGEVILVAVRSAKGVRTVSSARPTSGTSGTTSSNGQVGDLQLMFGIARTSSTTGTTVTCSTGALQAQRTADQNVGSALYSKAVAGLFEPVSWSWSSTTTGTYLATVALNG